jgi:3'(2'), 5'-bisphosphate nucleotidase
MAAPEQLVKHVLGIAERAGKEIMEVYEGGFTVTEKADRSPLTEADLRSHEAICRDLSELADLPILSEEAAAQPYDERAGWSRFWLVDPLDGTKEFVNRNGEFTVNIALIEDGVPVLGVVHAPCLELTYWAADGKAFRRDCQGMTEVHASDYIGGSLRVVASRSHAGPETEALLTHLRARLGDLDLVNRGSSLKLCMVADGQAHLYPRLGPTMEWDVAAADAVVRAAGGEVVNLRGHPLAYNKKSLLNPFFLVRAVGRGTRALVIDEFGQTSA